jgi:hypothetical protein
MLSSRLSRSEYWYQENVMTAMDREHEGTKLLGGTYYGPIMLFHHLHCLISHLYVVGYGFITIDAI